MTTPVFDKPEQFEQIRSGLPQGEQIIAVYDAIGAGTGFTGLTDRRVIVQDRSFVGKRMTLTSIPYSKITSVSVISTKSVGRVVLLHRRHRDSRGHAELRCASSSGGVAVTGSAA